MTTQELVPVIAAFGFGLQQFCQVVVDPLASILIAVMKKCKCCKESTDGTTGLPCGITDVDAKKSIIGFVSLVLGLGIAAWGNVQVLRTIGIKDHSVLDWLITGLTISAGTEGVNSIVKLVQYAKDVVKTRTAASVAQGSPHPHWPQTPPGGSAGS